MRLLLILFSLMLPALSAAAGAPSISSKVENIELNIKDHEMAVTFIGLSSGEATLIQGPNNENILVNTGKEDTAAELEGWLRLYDVKRIGTLILTSDGSGLSSQHVNHLIEKYQIKKIITTSKIAPLVTSELKHQNLLPVLVWKEGIKETLLPDLTVEVEFAGTGEDEGMDIVLSFFKQRVFLMSSYSDRAEEELFKKNLQDINVFKIPNCTKEDSLSKKLIQYLNPQISVLFTPEEKHLDPEILHHLQDSWSEVYFTKRHGTITLKFTDSKYEVFTIPPEAEQ
ncbi:ATP-dependent DNA helicase [Neobacillus niacini]|uniref:ATP-dependent DNA helicase n=1 Tax=Neobacillus niacini TaxID=86668 RepID=UPI0021CB963C|nr:ATP-dependent DNA helicase [Neobacillus niacini]MCM3766593.1 ATP-dependent DNA helicase [Neobacillus niacini]